MALRKHGPIFYAYYDQWTREGTTLKKRRVERSLGTDDRDIAKMLEIKLMTEARVASREARAGAKIESILNGHGGTVTRVHARRRMKISEAIARAERYTAVGETARLHWRRFERDSGFVFLDEVSPESALEYLERISTSGKSFNNIRSSLNGVYKILLIDAGLQESPFERIHARKVSAKCQRPFTHEEYLRLLSLASYPWKEAMQIAWWTGLRKKDVFQLKWAEIHGDLIRRLPSKTARFRREVLIPIHPSLATLLESLPRKGKNVLEVSKNEYDRGFNALLVRAGIRDDAETVNFNSFRNSFISRCDAAGIPRHAIRGIVGHVSDDMTDLYSHDETSARLIQALPE